MISVVISCYNGEEKISRMLDSLVSQSDKDSQIIIVNDGSTDRSPEIIKSYSDRLSFEYIDSCNMGISHARNLGMSYVIGEYVVFFDCDDYIDDDTIEKLNRLVRSKKDLYIFNYQKNDRIMRESIISINTKNDLYRSIIEKASIKGYVWNKLFKKDIIKDNKILFNENINFCEDLLFVCEYIKYIKDFQIVDMPFYHYYINESSITKKTFSMTKLSALDAIEMCVKNVAAFDSRSIYEEYYYRMLLSLAMNGYKQIKGNATLQNKFKNNLYQYSLNSISNPGLKLRVVLARKSLVISYLLWKILRR